MRKRPLLMWACVFCLGIVFRNSLQWYVLLAAGFVLIYDICHVQKIKSKIGRGLLLFSIFLLGYLHMHNNILFREQYLLQLKDGDSITIWGELYQMEHFDSGSNRMLLTDCYVSLSEQSKRIPCNDVMVYVSSANYQAGMILKINGQFHNFSTARNEGNFDSRSFYHSKKIDFYVDADSVSIKGMHESVVRNWTYRCKQEISKVYKRYLPEKAAGLLQGIILGDKTGIEEDIKDVFTENGIVHILTVSGLHVSLLGRNFYQFLRKRGWSFLMAGILAGILLIGYGDLTGNGVSTIRTVGMMLMFMLAQWMGRGYDMLNALGGMVLFLLWENPFLIEYTGLWFSITSLMGVGVTGKYFSVSGKVESFWMGLGVTLTTLPVVAWCYYEVPLYSVFLNMLVIPLLAPVFICGVIGGVAGVLLCNVFGVSTDALLSGVLDIILKVILYPCRLILELYEWLCEVAGRLPFSTIITGKPSIVLVVIYYVMLFIVVMYLRKLREEKAQINQTHEKRTKVKQREGVYEKEADGKGMREKDIHGKVVREKVLYEMVWNRNFMRLGISVAALFLLVFPKNHAFEITFLDVGQGDGIYMSLDGNDFFIDGGSVDVSGLGEYRILPFLKSKGIRDIEYWFVSHADTDHISGLLEVLESGYPVEKIVLSEAIPRDENYEKVINAARLSGASVCYMQAGDSVGLPNGQIKCIYPKDEVQEDRNDASLILQLDYDGKKALFTGDISTQVELDLLEQGLFEDVWLYKAAHHGSKNSNSTELLSTIRPEIVVVSCSSTNVYGHPAPEAIERMEAVGSEILYTMKSGQVSVKKDGIHILPEEE